MWRGGGAPFTHGDDVGSVLIDKVGATVRLLGISAEVLHEVRNHSQWQETKIAIASTTDEPSWAFECLNKFKTSPGQENFITCFDSIQVFHDNKRVHFQNMKKEYPNIEYSEMMFFDNQMNNIKDVSKLGVHCVFCPDGITENIWRDGLESFYSKRIWFNYEL